LGGFVSAARQYGVLIATILRHPEVATVSFDPFAREIRTEFLVRRVLEEGEEAAMRERLDDALTAYARLERKATAQRRLDVHVADGLTAITALWRADAVDPGEIGLVVDLLRDQLGDDLMGEGEAHADADAGEEEDPYLGEEIIAEKLADLSRLRGERRLVAVRDGGRLIVYHQ
jgi:hypothetical protein